MNAERSNAVLTKSQYLIAISATTIYVWNAIVPFDTVYCLTA